MKVYDTGLICGRFQTFHKGHERLVDTGLLLCDRLLILIGSAQECGTERNPFNINTRTKILREIYGDRPEVMIYGLADLTDENDIRPEWGRYLLNNTDRYIHKNPEIMIYGNDESRSNWFDKKDLANTAELIMDKAVEEYTKANGKAPSWMPNQYFAALTNMRSVGVMGDERTYDYAVALRAVNTVDFMTAESAEIPFEVLQRVMSRIINEVKGVNRVMYDLTSKPPGTIEFE